MTLMYLKRVPSATGNGMSWMPVAPKPQAPAVSFQASMQECEKSCEEAGTHVRQEARSFRLQTNRPPQVGQSALFRAWSWLQKRYVNSPAKRLRVAEVVSLGEKRFVALVNVEGREFLVGGGASGVSLMTPLESKLEPAAGIQTGLRVKGNSH
jgi:hypothetical protein